MIGGSVTQNARVRNIRLDQLEFDQSGHHFDMFSMRSEDVRFSPCGNRLAAVTTEGKILLYAVKLNVRPVQVVLLTRLVSKDLDAPHGIDWIGHETLVVANRRAGLAIFSVPRLERWDAETPIETLSTSTSPWFGAPGEMRDLGVRRIMTGAGSARVHGEYVYVGCNKGGTITRHRIRPGPLCDEGELVAEKGIEIPDGAVISPHGEWLVVSDHGRKCLLIFRLGEIFPCAELSDPRLVHPHGVAFDRTGSILLSADAGSRNLFIFHAPDIDWAVDQRKAVACIDGLEKSVFDRVQSETPEPFRALEGGTKGIDITRDGRVVVTTCRGQTLRFFALHAE